MSKLHLTKLTALTLVSCLTLSGCGSYVNSDVSEYPLVSALTTQEVVDYYAKALDYDSVVSKNITVHETTYVTQDIKGSKEEILKNLVTQAESILSQDEYEATDENANVVPEDVYNYMKATLDNEVLTNGSITQMKGALGYYFVDVEYDISAKEAGTFNQMTSLLGLDGVWLTQYDGTYKIDAGYLQTVVEKLNEYYADNGIMKCATFDNDNGIFEVLDGVAPTTTGITIDTSEYTYNEDTVIGGIEGVDTEAEDDTTETDGGLAEGIDGSELADTEETTGNETTVETEESTEETTVTTGQEYKTTSYNSIVSSERKIQIDVDLINQVAGASLNQKAFLPNLSLVYNKPESDGNISGYGIYTAGDAGLKLFGFDRNNLAGSITLRYVFKDDAAASGDIIGTNIYVVEEQITTGTNVTDQNVIIPDFLNSQLEQLIERSDRVQANVDLSGMMNGKIYEDMGIAVLAGFKNESSRTLKYMSTLRQVISRDIDNNAYEIEVETTVTEGPRSVDCYGTYKDKYYMVIQQQGNSFVISDMVRISRELTTEPPINTDSATTKRIVALNLAGEISDDTKSEINELMNDLYKASTARTLRVSSDEAPKVVSVNGTDISLNRGMYDCFDSDTTMLSSDEYEYMNSLLRNKLIKYGTSTPATMTGTVTSWIGGYDNQAEFMTEELITYSGTNTGYYAQVYYLVSKMNDVWVIDERTVIDDREVTGSDLDSIKSRLGQ